MGRTERIRKKKMVMMTKPLKKKKKRTTLLPRKKKTEKKRRRKCVKTAASLSALADEERSAFAKAKVLSVVNPKVKVRDVERAKRRAAKAVRKTNDENLDEEVKRLVI